MSVRERIVTLFEDVRDEKGRPWVADYVLDDLVAAADRPIDDSFRGKRLKLRFFDRVELEFAVCFPDEVFERVRTLDAFVAQVEKRIHRPGANLQLAEDRLRRAYMADPGLAGLVAVATGVAYAASSPPLLGPHLVLLAPNLLLGWFRLRDVSRRRALVHRIRAANGAPSRDRSAA